MLSSMSVSVMKTFAMTSFLKSALPQPNQRLQEVLSSKIRFLINLKFSSTKQRQSNSAIFVRRNCFSLLWMPWWRVWWAWIWAWCNLSDGKPRRWALRRFLLRCSHRYDETFESLHYFMMPFELHSFAINWKVFWQWYFSWGRNVMATWLQNHGEPNDRMLSTQMVPWWKGTDRWWMYL